MFVNSLSNFGFLFFYLINLYSFLISFDFIIAHMDMQRYMSFWKWNKKIWNYKPMKTIALRTFMFDDFIFVSSQVWQNFQTVFHFIKFNTKVPTYWPHASFLYIPTPTICNSLGDCDSSKLYLSQCLYVYVPVCLSRFLDVYLGYNGSDILCNLVEVLKLVLIEIIWN